VFERKERAVAHRFTHLAVHDAQPGGGRLRRAAAGAIRASNSGSSTGALIDPAMPATRREPVRRNTEQGGARRRAWTARSDSTADDPVGHAPVPTAASDWEAPMMRWCSDGDNGTERAGREPGNRIREEVRSLEESPLPVAAGSESPSA